MPQQPCSTYFLSVYDAELGLWVHTILGSGVSPRIQEAMNLILIKDGILAFIGTRLEFGHYLSELTNTHGTDFRHCWTSLPASTVMSMLGLCLNMPTSGRPELAFYGSPLTLMLALLMKERESDSYGEFLDEVKVTIKNSGLYTLDLMRVMEPEDLSVTHIGAYELQEALSYLNDEDVKVPYHGVNGLRETASH